MRRTPIDLYVNLLLLVSGLVMMYSGMALQLGFHMGGPRVHHISVHDAPSQPVSYEQLRGIDTNRIVSGLTYPTWSTIHKCTIILFCLLMIYHVYAHWRWYRQVVGKGLIHKNKPMVALSVFFLLVAVTGLIPWFIDLSGSGLASRILFIEIHDKLALILIVFLVWHMVKRAKWFVPSHAGPKGQKKGAPNLKLSSR